MRARPVQFFLRTEILGADRKRSASRRAPGIRDLMADLILKPISRVSLESDVDQPSPVANHLSLQPFRKIHQPDLGLDAKRPRRRSGLRTVAMVSSSKSNAVHCEKYTTQTDPLPQTNSLNAKGFNHKTSDCGPRILLLPGDEIPVPYRVRFEPSRDDEVRSRKFSCLLFDPKRLDSFANK